MANEPKKLKECYIKSYGFNSRHDKKRNQTVNELTLKIEVEDANEIIQWITKSIGKYGNLIFTSVQPELGKKLNSK